MKIVKHLDIFVLKSFLPLFAMTFFIVLFIVLMQFLWKYVDDLVGKGLGVDVISELFFYAAICMVPMSLPLAILLASLMTFGNFGEKFELTAMKASGISLLKVMRPLIVFIAMVAVGAFFFQNDVLPKAQVKMWTLLFSMKQKSPEVEIPESVFYDQIPGYNLYVSERDQNTGMLRRVMIYDVSSGGDNASIILADSCRLAFTRDMRYLYLHLFHGEQFENLRDQSGVSSDNIPFRRETFLDKEVMIPFDANFNRMDDGQMRKQYVGKNIAELRQTIDSVGRRVDSIGTGYSRMLRSQEIMGIRPEIDRKTRDVLPYTAVKMPEKIPHLNELMSELSPSEANTVYSLALTRASVNKMDYEFKSETMSDERKSIRRHEIELIKKFTLSVACLIFFFIGAPLGAIIRKGGIGTPLVISVLLFLVYYIIDNTGYKMSRDGRWNVWFGMWLSTLILTPLGVYVTIKAMNDSSVFDRDRYRRIIRNLFCMKEKRYVTRKEVIINDVDVSHALSLISRADETAERVSSSLPSGVRGYAVYWNRGIDTGALIDFGEECDRIVEYLHDSRDNRVIKLLNGIPVPGNPWVLHTSCGISWIDKVMEWFIPVGIPLYVLAVLASVRLRRQIDSYRSVSEKLRSVLDPVAFPEIMAEEAAEPENNDDSVEE